MNRMVLFLLVSMSAAWCVGCQSVPESPAKPQGPLTEKQAMEKIASDPRIQKYKAWNARASKGRGEMVLVPHGEEKIEGKTYYAISFSEKLPTHFTTVAHLSVDKQTGDVFVWDFETDGLRPFDAWWETHYGDFDFEKTPQ